MCALAVGSEHSFDLLLCPITGLGVFNLRAPAVDHVAGDTPVILSERHAFADLDRFPLGINVVVLGEMRRTKPFDKPDRGIP